MATPTKNMTAEEVRDWVFGMGKAFKPYGEVLFGWGVGGEDMLADFDTISDELGFKKKTLKNRFKREWTKLNNRTPTPATPQTQPETSISNSHEPSEHSQSDKEAGTPKGKKCQFCTFINQKARTRCEMCGNELSQVQGETERKNETAIECGAGGRAAPEPGAREPNNPPPVAPNQDQSEGQYEHDNGHEHVFSPGDEVYTAGVENPKYKGELCNIVGPAKDPERIAVRFLNGEVKAIKKSALQLKSHVLSNPDDIEEELKDLLFFFFLEDWDVSHIESALMKYPENERETMRLAMYRKFKETGPYQLHYLAEELEEKKAYPKDESPKPPNFDAMSKCELDDFCRRLNIYTGDIKKDFKSLRERLREFEISEEKQEHAEHKANSVEDAYAKYKEVLAEILAIADNMKDLHLPLHSKAELSADFQQNFKKCHNAGEKINQKDSSIFVFGDTSAGKSTFINLLIESDLLPSSVKSGLTTTVCHLTGVCDPKEARIDATQKDGNVRLGKQLDTENIVASRTAIRQFAAEDNQHNPQFKRVDIKWPSELLNSGISLVDSPGLNFARQNKQDSYWWIDKVREYVKESIATICLLTPPGVPETVADCLRLLVETQGNNGTYEPASIFFVVTHLDQESDVKDQKIVMQDIKEKLKGLVPGCPIETNVVQINLKAAANARRWNLYSPEHIQLMVALRQYFVFCFKFYLINAYTILYSPVLKIYEGIHDHLQYRGVQTQQERQKQTKELMERKEELLDVKALLEEKMKEYEKDIKKLKKEICSDTRKRLKQKREDILEQTLRFDISTLTEDLENDAEIEETPTDEKYNEKADETLLRCVALERLMRREVYNFVVEKEDERKKAIDVINARATVVYIAAHGLQNKMRPKGIELPFEYLGDMLPDLNILRSRTKLGMLAGLGVGGAAAAITLGLATTIIIPGVGLGLAAISLLVALPYVAKKTYDKHKKLKRAENELGDKYDELLEEEKIKELLLSFAFLSQLSDNVFDPIRAEISGLSVRVGSQERLLKSPNSCQKLEDLNEIKTRMNAIQNSLLLVRYQHLVDPTFKNPIDAVAELPRGPLGCEHKYQDLPSYKVQHCLTRKCDLQEGKPDEKEAPVNRHIIVKSYDMKSHNAAIVFQSDQKFLKKINPDRYLAEFYGFSKTEEHLQLITEYLEGGSLSDWLNNYGAQLTAVDLTDVAISIALGMENLEKQGLVHGNLRPENILISHHNRTAKISQHYTNTSENRSVEALLYQPPEILVQSKIGNEMLLDVYSFGVILWEMWHMKKPFADMKTLQKFTSHIVDGKRPDFDKAVPKEISVLCGKCWATNCAGRPSWREIVEVLKATKLYHGSQML